MPKNFDFQKKVHTFELVYPYWWHLTYFTYIKSRSYEKAKQASYFGC